MEFGRGIPSEGLRGVVKQYLDISTEVEFSNSLLPDTRLTVAFRYRGQGWMGESGVVLAMPRLAISGIRETARKVVHSPGGLFITQFTELGAAAVFGLPLHELRGSLVGFDSVFGAVIGRELEDRLSEADGVGGRIRAMEGFLASRLAGWDQDGEVALAVEKIQAARGQLRVRELAREIGLSQSALERRFRQAVGTSPKHFASLVRMQYVIDQHDRGKNLGDLAQEAGFYDQAHFAHAFKAFAGEPAESYFQSAHRW